MRIYGRTHGEQALETVLTDTVVFTLLSERKLGPKLHGIFPGGRIEQYIPVSRSVFEVYLFCNFLVEFDFNDKKVHRIYVVLNYTFFK